MRKSDQRKDELWASAEELLEILENLSDSVQVVDENYIMCWMNKASEAEGTPRGKIIGRNVLELRDEGIFKGVVSPAVFKEKKTVSILAAGQNEKEMLLTGVPIIKDGKVKKVIISSRDITELKDIERKFLEAKEMAAYYKNELDILKRRQSFEITYESEPMRKVVALANAVAKTDATVLILGESGTGKGLLGEYIHKLSKRKNERCVKIDCGAIPENLIESELFGYEEGSFTGALKGGKIGMMQMADKGTLILDEIADLPYNMQVKLLRLIQDKEVFKIGGERSIHVDARIIAMTNKDLGEMMKEGTFREDLYYRLNVVMLKLPPLRERKEDIVHLMVRFLDVFNEKYEQKKYFSPEIFNIFYKYIWPGNIREMENIIERLVIVTPGEEITPAYLPEHMKNETIMQSARPSIGYGGFKYQMECFEKELFSNYQRMYEKVGVIYEKLEVDRSTVRKKLKKYGLNEMK